MAVDLSTAAGVNDPTLVLLQWPPDPSLMVHQVMAFVVMRREGGILLVVPDQCLDDESLVAAQQVPADGEDPLVGLHKIFLAPLLVSGPAGNGELEPALDSVPFLVVDMNLPVIASLIQAFPEEGGDLDLINMFGENDPFAKPDFQVLLPQIKAWLADELGAGSAYATAAEEEEAVETPRRAKSSLPGSSIKPGAKAPAVPKQGQKKPTVASISQQMDTVLAALPSIVDQLTALTRRQDDLERGGRSTASGSKDVPAFKAVTASKTSAPVSGMLASTGTPNIAALASQLGRPPLGQPARSKKISPSLDGEPMEPEDFLPRDPRTDLEEEEEMGTPMERALLQQSKVLSAVMAHFHNSGNDPFTDLSSSGPTTGVKGTMARERLQRELADGSGAFFLKVCQQIQRRMAPTTRPASDLSRVQDVSLLAYLERYGGYGQNRELGMVQWSLGHAFDAAAREEWGLVRDHLALTSVMVEQASLDANKWHLAWLLRLLDDPPQNLWLNRGQTAVGTKRPFAPLCAQNWTTTALAYLKEAEVLQGKRSDLLGDKDKDKKQSEGGQPKATPKKRPGKGGTKSQQAPIPEQEM